MRKLIYLCLISFLLSVTPQVAGASHLSRAEVFNYTAAGANVKMMALPTWITELIKTAVDQVLKAMNLALMRLQNKNINLMNVAKLLESKIHSEGMQNLMETGQKMKDLYEQYYDDLKRVKDVIVTIATLKDLVERERDFIALYADILDMVNNNEVFSAAEIKLIVSSSDRVFTNATTSIAEVETVIESFKTDMSDAERLILIKGINNRINADLMSMKQMRNGVLQIIARRNHTESNSIRQLYYNE